MSIIALFVVLLISASAGSDRTYQAATGFSAPVFRIQSTDGNVLSLADFKGSYVLVSFWASTDAASRINANLYDRYVKQAPENEQVSLLSVNLDRNEHLFQEIVRRDNLDAKTQFHVHGEQASEIMKSYRQSAKNCQSFLIDPKGVIVAVDPDVEALAKFVS